MPPVKVPVASPNHKVPRAGVLDDGVAHRAAGAAAVLDAQQDGVHGVVDDGASRDEEARTGTGRGTEAEVVAIATGIDGDRLGAGGEIGKGDVLGGSGGGRPVDVQ